ncbi:hypothetical protein AXX17_AT3G33880 [Arabidopsis thaliana]|uniref:RNase H type-1 domain-containing protein n=1 Tax=Arabidopsis thaliana TaxID=3702 RepID=A0A178V880_ARATH|nr:hypothetical protein AXX17_AT3G33880 [Arabidopsis thaliana]
MKAQVLADFLTELPVLGGREQPENQTWKLHVDGSSSKNRSEVGIKLESPTSKILEQSFRLLFTASNNKAEYEALIAGLRLAQGVGADEVITYYDSQLIVNQLNEDYEAKDSRMEAYLEVVKDLAKYFKKFELIRIPRGENTIVDALAALASTSDPEVKRIIPVESQDRNEPAIELPPVKRRKSKGAAVPKPAVQEDNRVEEIVEPIEDIVPENTVEAETELWVDEDVLEPNEHPEPEARIFYEIDQIPAKDWGAVWREPIKNYIVTGELPENRWQARKMRIVSAKFCLSKDSLYKRGVSDPYLLCIFGPEVEIVMSEVHEGLCGSHSSGRAMAFKIKRMGYYWPNMIMDCVKYAQRCKRCQLHAPPIHQPSELFSSISATYPFMRWSMDIIGPLHMSTREHHRYLQIENHVSMTDFHDSVDRHHQGADRHPLQNQTATIGDFNRIDIFYTNRSAFKLPPFEREDFAIHHAYYDLVSRGKFRGAPDESPLDHLEVFKDIVSSIKAEGVPADYLLCKLFPHSLASRGTSWLCQLEPSSLTNWTDTKNAFMNHFFDESVTEALRLQISLFTQAPAESLRAAWLSFSRMESMLAQILGKFESVYTDLNGKIDNLRSHISEFSPTSVSINAVTLRSGKQLNPIHQRERSAQTSSFPVVEKDSVSIDASGCRSTPITLDDSVLPLSSGIDNFTEEKEIIPDGVDRHPIPCRSTPSLFRQCANSG